VVLRWKTFKLCLALDDGITPILHSSLPRLREETYQTSSSSLTINHGLVCQNTTVVLHRWKFDKQSLRPNYPAPANRHCTYDQLPHYYSAKRILQFYVNYGRRSDDQTATETHERTPLDKIHLHRLKNPRGSSVPLEIGSKLLPHSWLSYSSRSMRSLTSAYQLAHSLAHQLATHSCTTRLATWSFLRVKRKRESRRKEKESELPPNLASVTVTS